MGQVKGVLVGAVAMAMLMASGCESKPVQPQVDRQETPGTQLNNRGSDLSPQGPAGTVRDGTADQGTGGSGAGMGGAGMGGTDTGDVQGSGSSTMGKDTMGSQPMGGSTGTGTEGSDMGSGGATNSAQDQGTPPR